MKSVEDRDDTSAFRAANARLLIAQSRARIDAWKLLKKHAKEHFRTSRELLSESKSRR